MISFDTLNVCDDIKSTLKQYEIDFAFQPIYSRFGTVVAHEALMRPKGKNVLDFIDEMREQDKLHELELLTFFGATLAYKERGYESLLSINSFPADALTKEEVSEYAKCFMTIHEKLIIEILEYTEEKHWTWNAKKEHIKKHMGIEVALDDFGTGYNDEDAVDYYNPHMIKLDRHLISSVNTDIEKQRYIKELIHKMHSRMIVVLAEGVETEEEYNCLKSIGIDFFQGFYLGRPA